MAGPCWYSIQEMAPLLHHDALSRLVQARTLCGGLAEAPRSTMCRIASWSHSMLSAVVAARFFSRTLDP
jgi:hypothetical protein